MAARHLGGAGQDRLFESRANDSGRAAAYEESLAITRRLAGTDPNDSQLQRVLPSANKMGDVKFFASGDAKGAIAEDEEVRPHARGSPTRTKAMPSCGATCPSASTRLGDVKVRSQNDIAGALAAYDESLAIARHLAGVDRPCCAMADDCPLAL